MSKVLPRLVLGYVLALPFVAYWIADSRGSEPRHMLVLRMSSTIAGPLQLFYDVGTGFTEQHSVSTGLVVSDEPVEYRLPLPSATYRNLRIDPGVEPGVHTIEKAAILGADGSKEVTIPLTELQALQQIVLLERSADRLVVSVPPDSGDPILVWTPPAPLTLVGSTSSHPLGLSGSVAVLWLGASAAVWGLEWLLRRASPAGAGFLKSTSAFGTRHRGVVIVMTALVASAAATYPILFAGRSFASPSNGGLMMLYEHPPFLPGSADGEVEDTRGADVGVMMWQSVPHALVERQALVTGEVPLWNRYNALGRPLWGQGLSYVLDPLHWWTFLRSEPALGWDLKFVSHRLVFAIGIGLASLTATGALLPAAIAAAAAPFAGAFTFRVNHPAIFSLAYAPWALLAWFLLARATTAAACARAAILLTISSSLVLVASPPKEGAIAVLGMSVTGAIAVLLSTGSWRLRSQRLVAAVVAGLAAALLTMPHWLVFLDALHASVHAYETPNVALAGLVHAVALFSSPITPLPGLHLFALVLVAGAVTAPRCWWRDRSIRASAIGAALLIGLAFGMVPASLLLRIPYLGNIGHLGDALLMAALTPLLVFCAAGAQALSNANPSRAVAVTIVTGVAAIWLCIGIGRVFSVDSFEVWAVALLAPLAVSWPACLFSARRQSATAAVSVLIVMGVLLVPGGLHLETGVPGIDRFLLQPRPRPRLEQSSPAIDAIRETTSEPMRTVGVAFAFFTGTHALYELEDVRGADPLEALPHRELMDAIGMQRSLYWLIAFGPADVPRLDPILDMLNVGFLVTRPDIIPSGSHVLSMKAADRVRPIRRPTPWPRAFFTSGASEYETPADLVHEVTARRRPFATILKGDARAADATRGLPRSSGPVMPADHYVLTANTTTFRVRAGTEGIAVLAETYLPDDFVVRLNGAPVPYFRVNHVFKGVRIPGPGEWEVSFEYRPHRWGVAVGGAGVGVLVLIVTGVVACWGVWVRRASPERVQC